MVVEADALPSPRACLAAAAGVATESTAGNQRRASVMDCLDSPAARIMLLLLLILLTVVPPRPCPPPPGVTHTHKHTHTHTRKKKKNRWS